MKDLIAKIRAALGDAGKELADKLEAELTKLNTDLDTEKAAKLDAEKKLKESDKAKTDAEKKAAKAVADLDAKTKGEGEETAKLRTERDEAKARAEAAEAKADGLHLDYAIREALATKYGLLDPDAAKLFDTSSIKLDKGQLVGLDAVVGKWKGAKPYLFKPAEADDKGTGGGVSKAGGAGDKKGAGGGQQGTKTPAELARESLERTGFVKAPPATQAVQAPSNPLTRLLGQ